MNLSKSDILISEDMKLYSTCLEEVRCGFTLWATKSQAVKVRHHFGSLAMVHNVAISNEHDVIKKIIRLWLRLQQCHSDSGICCVRPIGK